MEDLVDMKDFLEDLKDSLVWSLGPSSGVGVLLGGLELSSQYSEVSFGDLEKPP